MTTRSAAAKATPEGSDGLAMRLARLHTAVVIRAVALPVRSARIRTRSVTGTAVAWRIASAPIIPKLGDAHGEAIGEGISSGMNKLGEIGRNWFWAEAGSCVRLGEPRPVVHAGSSDTSDGLTTVRLRRVSILQIDKLVQIFCGTADSK